VTTVASVFAAFDGTPDEWKEFADHSRATRSAGGVMIDVSFY
jgi:hypothetical protein